MVDLKSDQASGLRAMFRRFPTQRVSFAGAMEGVGNTSIALGAALEAARSGLRVTVIDEHQGAGSVTARLGLTSRLDLLQAINRDAPLASVRLASQQGISVVPAARLATASKQLNRLQMEALDEALVELTRDTELLIVDCAPDDGQLSLLARRSDRLAVVTAASGVSITAAYALIKRHVTGNAPLPLRPPHSRLSSPPWLPPSFLTFVFCLPLITRTSSATTTELQQALLSVFASARTNANLPSILKTAVFLGSFVSKSARLFLPR